MSDIPRKRRKQLSQSSTGRGIDRARQFEAELRDSVDRGHFDRMRELVEMERVDVNCVDRYGKTPLMLKPMNTPSRRFAKFLLENGANANAVDNDGESVLAHNILCVEVMELLLKHGAAVDTVSKKGRTALGNAVSEVYIDAVELLLDHGADIEAPCDGPNSPLALSLETEDYRDMMEDPVWRGANVNETYDERDIMEVLVRRGANVNETLYNNMPYSALHLALHHGHSRRARFLLENGADVNNIQYGYLWGAMTPLCKALACRFTCNMTSMYDAELLIENGARVIYDGEYPESPSPLLHAVYRGLELVRFLLDNSRFSANGNLNARPLEMGEHFGRPLSDPLVEAIIQNKLDVVQLLVERGANVNDDQRFLWFCVEYDRCEIAQFLLRSGANVNLEKLFEEDRDAETPLFAAAEKGRIQLVKEFLKAGADVSIRNNSGETPLFAAAEKGRIQVVEELLKAGADVSIRNNSGETPLGAARRKGHKYIVYLLVRTSPNVWSKLKKGW